ncbi:MAG: Ornithine carbamoyltransferase subunit I [Sodalis sp.]|nr:MAG: Ornithine carbamoyltransferase subunit I [Sodalis sp.]
MAGRIALLGAYQVNMAMRRSFLHCLSAFHDDQTILGNSETLRLSERHGSDRQGI